VARASGTAPVRLKNLGSQLSLSFSPLARKYLQIQRPLSPFRAGDAASSDILRTQLVFVHQLLLSCQRDTVHAVRVIP